MNTASIVLKLSPFGAVQMRSKLYHDGYNENGRSAVECFMCNNPVLKLEDTDGSLCIVWKWVRWKTTYPEIAWLTSLLDSMEKSDYSLDFLGEEFGDIAHRGRYEHPFKGLYMRSVVKYEGKEVA